MKRVIIDTDPGIDDTIALLLLCASDDVVIEGITTVGGNVSLDQVTRNALTILELAGRTDIGVYRGAAGSMSGGEGRQVFAHGEDGLGNLGLSPTSAVGAREGSAVDFLVESAREHPGEMSLLPIGPLTNVAAAVLADPAFVSNIGQIVLMGGAEGAGNMTPSAEFNAWSDPVAADVVFRAGFDRLVMVGLDATRQAHLTPGVRELLRQLDTPVSRFVHAITRSYVDFAFAEQGRLAAELHDPLAAAYLLDPAVFVSHPANVEVCTEGLCQGRTVVARSSDFPHLTPNARVAGEVDAGRFFTLLLTTLFPDASELITRVVAHEYR